MRLTRFWASLERVRGLTALPALWRALLQDEYGPTNSLFRPQNRLASSYPRLAGGGGTAPYRVVTHGPDDHVAVCPDTGHTIKLTTAEITLRELNRRTVQRAVAEALGVEPTTSEIGAGLTWHIGTIASESGERLSTFLAFASEPHELHSAVDRLVASVDGPFLLLTPTYRLASRGFETTLRSRGAQHLALCDGLTLNTEGKFSSTEAASAVLGRLKCAADGPGTESADPYEFRRLGEVWVVRFAGETIYLEDSRGLHYLHELITQRGKSLHAASLLANAAGEGRRLALGSVGETLDAQAVENYKRHILDLQDQLAEAECNCDLGRQESASRELDALISKLAKATGLGGRRRVQTDAQRVRKAVCNAVNRALDKISQYNADLHRHLENAIRRGRHLSYCPDQPLEWTT